MNYARSKKYRAMTIPYLKRFRDDLSVLISDLDSGPRREIDIGASHTGDPALVQEVLEVSGDKSSGKWRELQRIYCSLMHCPQCPHGPFWYKYRKSKRKKTPVVAYEGMLVFDYDPIKRWNVKPPVFVGTIEEIAKPNRDGTGADRSPQDQGDREEGS